jgi:hydrogenase maturation protein HypF
MIERREIQVCGTVQSVGFRPFIYALARRHNLKGTVRNNERGVLLDIEGDSDGATQFLLDLRADPPPLARIDSIECQNGLQLKGYVDFSIDQTTLDGPKLVPVSADVATCAECLRELFDPYDRRFRCLRDPTRGGVATTLNEIAFSSGVCIGSRKTAYL